MLVPRWLFLALFALITPALGGSAALNVSIVPGSTSVSGLSSGAYFAVQYEIAHSATIAGAAIFAGGPYFCAMDNTIAALTACMEYPELIPVDALVDAADGFAMLGSIDPLAYLQSHNVFVFSGSKDTIVVPEVAAKLLAMYKEFGVVNVTAKLDIEHAFPTTNYGNACAYEGSPWINNCDFDGAGAALETLYGPLRPPVTPLRKLAQQSFTPGGVDPVDLSLGTTAYYYLPTALCRLHVAFHGCRQFAESVGTVFVEHSGLNAWAESNNIIVLYPQTVNSDVLPFNPKACWDWWGYLGPNYAVQSGLQMTFVRNLINYFTSAQ